MSEGTIGEVLEKNPDETFQDLSNTPGAAMVDVRTRAEWSFVGAANLNSLGKPLWLVEWQGLPDMAVNGAFVDQLRSQFGGTPPERIYFICRSGARSMHAARTA